MTCLKCGRETDQTFCDLCRAEMEKYPVKPGTIVQLPKDRAAFGKRQQPRRQSVPPEVRITAQRLTIRRLRRAVAVLLTLVILLGLAIFRVLRNTNARPTGQNYSTMATKPSEDATAPTLASEEFDSSAMD